MWRKAQAIRGKSHKEALSSKFFAERCYYNINAFPKCSLCLKKVFMGFQNPTHCIIPQFRT
jgi:hypothetical protein